MTEKVLKESADKVTEKGNKVETVKPEVTSKQVSLIYSSDLHYKFDEVVTEGQGQLNFKAFDFGVFKGMGLEIKKLIQEYETIEKNSMFSEEYKAEKRNDSFVKISMLKQEYLNKAKAQLEDLRKPVLTTTTLTSTAEQLNMLKRLNNSIVFSNLMANASIEDMENLFEDNKDNAEIRVQLKTKVISIANKASGLLKDKAIKLKSKIAQYEQEITNVEYFDELDSLERSLNYLFSERNFEYYHATLENGFEDAGLTKIFKK